MKDLKHITRFNESDENLNISDVSHSFNDMKQKVNTTLEFKEKQLQELLKQIGFETKKLKLEDLYKNEIEIRAQISILRHLLSE
jgi:hypothetical protein